MGSTIEWTDETWNPTVGCQAVSPGCRNCYAQRVAHRGMSPQHRGLTVLKERGPVWTGAVNDAGHEVLVKPLRWRRRRRVFVDSMSDLFYEEIPDETLDRIFGVMLIAAMDRGHVFQVLTKRAQRMYEYLTQDPAKLAGRIAFKGAALLDLNANTWHDKLYEHVRRWGPIHENLWMGVSVEDQQRGDERIPLLLESPACVRFLSCEPLLEYVDVHRFVGEVDWVILGGESGPGARPCDHRWILRMLGDCMARDVPVFVKQLGSRYVPRNAHPAPLDRKGGDPDEWPLALRVRQFPEACVWA